VQSAPVKVSSTWNMPQKQLYSSNVTEMVSIMNSKNSILKMLQLCWNCYVSLHTKNLLVCTVFLYNR